MMENTDERKSNLKSLLDRVRAGSVDAAWELVDLYWPHIYRYVHRRLDSRLRPIFDSEDFVQAVWLSFFKNPTRIHSFESPSKIIVYLVRMAQNKILEENRRRLYGKRYNSRSTVSLDDSSLDPGSLVAGPTPSAVAMVRERWDRLLASQPRHYKEIARLKTMGAKTAEIASRVNMDRRSVRKVIDRLMARNW